MCSRTTRTQAWRARSSRAAPYSSWSSGSPSTVTQIPSSSRPSSPPTATSVNLTSCLDYSSKDILFVQNRKKHYRSVRKSKKGKSYVKAQAPCMVNPTTFLGKPLKVFPFRASVGIVASVRAILCILPTLSQSYISFSHVCRQEQTVKLWGWLCWFRGNR